MTLYLTWCSSATTWTTCWGCEEMSVMSLLDMKYNTVLIKKHLGSFPFTSYCLLPISSVAHEASSPAVALLSAAERNKHVLKICVWKENFWEAFFCCYASLWLNSSTEFTKGCTVFCFRQILDLQEKKRKRKKRKKNHAEEPEYNQQLYSYI